MLRFIGLLGRQESQLSKEGKTLAYYAQRLEYGKESSCTSHEINQKTLQWTLYFSLRR